MMSVFIKRGHWHIETHTQVECHGKVKAEIGVVLLQAEEHQKSAAATRS